METVEYIAAKVVPTVAEPKVWNPNTQYDNLVIVQESEDAGGSYYISKKPVPPGTPLSDTEYWLFFFQDGATVSIGEVNTVDNLQDASVVNVGTLYNAILDFSIPRGADGQILDAAGTVVTGSEIEVESPLDDGAFAHLDVFGRALQDGTPTPDSPVPIVVCKGRNLFDLGSSANDYICPQTVANSLTIANDKLSSVAVDSGLTRLIRKKPFNPGTYTFGYNCNVPNVSYRIIIQVFNENGENISSSASVGGFTYNQYYEGLYAESNVKAFTVSNCSYFYVGACISNVSAGTSFEFSQIQLELGSTSTPYVPYGHVGLEVQGRNLVSPNSIKNWGVASAIVFDSGARTIALPVTRNTDYTVSYAAGNRMHIAGTGDVIPAAGVQVTDIYTSYQSDSPKTFNSGNNDYVVIQIAGDNGAISNVQVERGSVAHAYEPYFETVTPIPIPESGLASLPDGTHDVLSVDGAGHVSVVKATNEVVFDGSQSDLTVTRLTGFTQVSWNEYVTIGAADAVFYCDKLVYTNVNTRDLNKIWSNVTVPRMFMGLPDSITSVVDAQTWLTTHPITVLYPIATPTTWDGGYIDLPELPDGCTVSTLATLTPVNDLYYWTEGGAVEQRCFADVWEYLAALSQRVTDLETAVAEL